MALLNPNFTNIPVLSKLKVGEQTYYLKDAELRALVATFGDAVKYQVDTTFNPDSSNLVTSAAMADYLEEAIAGLTGAMHFVGVATKQEGETDVAALDRVFPSSADGDVALVGTAEYVRYSGAWHLIGDEGVYATITGVEAAYVKKTLTIAGIDLQDNITAAELKTALGLGALAYKDSATGTVTGVVTGVQDATYTPAGDVAVELAHTATAMASSGSYTPAGEVTGNVTAAGTVALAETEDGVQITGTVSAPTLTITPSTASIKHISSLGKLPTYTAAQYTPPSVSETKAQFASEGIVAEVQSDEELLVFSAASKTNALTGTGFNAGSYTDAQFNAGELPAYGTAQTVVTGISKAEASAPTFTGHKYSATFNGTQTAITAEFEGTAATVSVSGSYDKASVKSAGFTGTEATISHAVTTGNKSVTVS